MIPSTAPGFSSTGAAEPQARTISLGAVEKLLGVEANNGGRNHGRNSKSAE